MNPAMIGGIDCICLVLLIQAIVTSSRRLVSLGYAVLGFGLVLVLGMVAVFFLMPARGTVVDVNSTLDMVGSAVSIGAPIAAVWAAHKPPRRGQA